MNILSLWSFQPINDISEFILKGLENIFQFVFQSLSEDSLPFAWIIELSAIKNLKFSELKSVQMGHNTDKRKLVSRSLDIWNF
jgi:hypothetical protein